jgi:sortase system peptidoglycan-associated protein
MAYSHFITGAALCVVATCSAAQTATVETTNINTSDEHSGANYHVNNRVNSESTHSAFGFGGGLLTGAALGGPVGAIIGATLGVLMVEEHNDDTRIESLQHDLVIARHALSAKDEELVTLVSAQQQQYQSIQPVSYSTTIVPDFPEMKSHIQFISGMTEIAPSYFDQLDLLANVLKDNAKLQVSLTGFADLRGSSEDNLLLSAARTDAVKEYLLNAQVPVQQINTFSLGESQAQQASTWDETLFFDRRVTLHITPITTMTAAN